MPVSAKQWTALGEELLKAAGKFNTYSYRHFFKRRVTEQLNEYRQVADPKKAEELYAKAQQELQALHRQATIDSMYKARPLVIEKQQQQ